MDEVKPVPDVEAKRRQLLALLLKERGIDPLRSPIVPRPRRDEPFPLSFAQERLWVLDQIEPGNVAYNVARPVRIEGWLRVDILARAWTEIVRRHEPLRTTFGTVDGRPVQLVAPPSAVRVPLVDLAGLSASRHDAEALRLAGDEESRPFDLARGPVLRLTLIRQAGDRHVQLLGVHHITSDGWSGTILFTELQYLYESFAAGLPSPLPELPVQYADFAAWQRHAYGGEALAGSLAYWRKQLAGVPVLELPTDRPRPPVQGLAGSVLPVSLSVPLTEGLKALTRNEGATLFMTLTAAFQALLARASGQIDISVGTPVANRHRTETEGLVGFFVNTLVLRTDLSGNPTFRELLGRVKRMASDAFTHQQVPFSQVVEELKPERSLAYTPLFQVMFSLGAAPSSSAEGASAGTSAAEALQATIRLREFERRGETAMFDLNMLLGESGRRLAGTLELRTDLFDEVTVVRLLEHYRILMEAVAADPERRLSELPLLTEGERQQALVEWNDSDWVAPQASLEERFLETARRQPDAPALLFVDGAGETASWSYGELFGAASRLASRLVRLGVGPDVRVALCAERSPELVVAVLAVLQAGGAYLALDPAYPAERLALMLEDSRARVLLAQEALLPLLPPFAGEVVHLAVARGTEADLPERAAAAPPEALAYLIYTSGSTGRPKGVAMSRGALRNLLAWQKRWAIPGVARTLQFAALSFDVSFQEIASTLSTGGTLVVVPEETRRDPRALLGVLEGLAVERIFLPFVALRGLADAVEEGAAAGSALTDIVTAGEALAVTRSVAAWMALRPGRRLHNQYGPSESHVVTAETLSGDPAGWPALPPIGRPVANVRIFLLDAGLQPVPIGVPGELCIAGTALARGYLDRPEPTAERFVPDAWSPLASPGGRIYRTGDLARFRASGAIEFLGRSDQQVKIRGIRVEPGEVEAAIAAHPAVRQAVVVTESEGSGGGVRLAAYFVAEGDAAQLTAELRDRLSAQLPAALVPSRFVPLPALPLTPSGKVDRKALAQRRLGDESADGAGGEDFVPPRTPVEELVVGA